MDEWKLALGAAVMALLMFTLGASVAWRLEGRRPHVAPSWLHVLSGLSLLAMAIYIVVAFDPPSRLIAVDPLWWNALKAVLLVLAVTAMALRIREALRASRT